MGRTHEALKRAEKEYHQNYIVTQTRPLPPAVIPPSNGVARNIRAKSYYEGLKTNLLARSSKGSLKTILFNGTAHGDGCSTTAINFATALTEDSKRRVLLVEVNMRTPSFQNRFNIDDNLGLPQVLKDSCTLEPSMSKVGPGDLYVLTCGGELFSGPLGILESSDFDLFLKETREKFDFVILDSPPVPTFSEFRVLCRKVDGVVLVINARRTRKQVALRAKKELEEAGANILGIVHNKRKYYIPKWVYKMI